jgi:hypothetical protein
MKRTHCRFYLHIHFRENNVTRVFAKEYVDTPEDFTELREYFLAKLL